MKIDDIFQRPYKDTLQEKKETLFGQLMQITEDMIYKERWVAIGDKIPEDFFWKNFVANTQAYQRIDYMRRTHNISIQDVPTEMLKTTADFAMYAFYLPKKQMSEEQYFATIDVMMALRLKYGWLPPPSAKVKRQAIINMLSFLILTGLTICFFFVSPLLGVCGLGCIFYWIKSRWGWVRKI
ncbi:MAG: hypothetical protein IJD52_01560 [Alphaproteobacteria bacterium]|nr:hypothetical protein [Alphaproteobacteria bacterium]